MNIVRILTNNAVVVDDIQNGEKIVCGKGIGYKKRIGDKVDESLINQVFCLQNSDMNMKFQELLQDIPLEEIRVADDIIQYARKKLDRELDDSIYVLLSDHIHMALARFLDGILIKTPSYGI